MNPRFENSRDIVAELQSVEQLSSVPEEQLLWLIERSECRRYDQGEQLFDHGSPIDKLFIVLRGKFDLKIHQNNQYRVIGHFDTHDISGALPYSRGTTATGSSHAVEESYMLSMSKSHFGDMIRNQHELTTALVHVMSTRIRYFTKRQQQDDKIMALGKLSAGLAHELNNPSAAVVRSARALKKHLAFLPEGFKRVIQIRADESSVDAVNDLLFSRISRGMDPLSMMERAALEDDLLDWLEDKAVTEPDVIAEVLADFRFSTEDLDQIAGRLRQEDIGPVINWMGQVLTTEKMVNEIEEASQRIGNLVSSIKSYTHMDQAPERKRADIHTGLRNTLTMLGHKIRKSGIELVERFDESIAQPRIFVSELNQVWTNLIDNAIDAMDESDDKRLEIETQRNGRFIRVNIRDSGKGIPIELQDKIFDPFFTTKDVGQGTGLGLEVVRQIIAQHNGRIDVESRPGMTVFMVDLPID